MKGLPMARYFILALSFVAYSAITAVKYDGGDEI
jgi:hypothetical protein